MEITNLVIFLRFKVVFRKNPKSNQNRKKSEETQKFKNIQKLVKTN